jgi:competence protein ComEC
MPTLPRAAWLALGAIGAALLADGGGLSLGLPAAATIAMATAALLIGGVALRRERMAVAALAIGIGAVGLRAGLGVAVGAAAMVAPLPTGSSQWHAQVVDVSSPSGAEQRAFLHLADEVDDPVSEGTAGWLVYAWLPRHPALVPGDLLTVRGTLEPPPLDAPGFAGFLASQGAVGTLKATSLDLLGEGSGGMASVEQLRWAIDGALARAIPEPEAGLAAGILIGLRERVSRAVADDFTTTGLTHVVAISGWNIALVAGIATSLLRAAGLARRPRSLLVIVAIVVYTILAGAEASVIRAALMGGIVLLAREGGRPAGAAAALGIACAGLLLAEPRMIGDIGLQLSLAATAGLLALGGSSEAAVRRLTRGRAPRWFCETLGVSLAAQLATLPLILLHFGRLSLISPLANLLVAPVVPLAMLGAVVGVGAGLLLAIPALGPLLAPLDLLAWLPLATMVRGAGLLSQVPLASVELPAGLSVLAAVLSLLVLLGVLRRARSPTGSATVTDPRPQASGSEPRKHPGRRVRVVAAVLVSATLVVTVSTVLAARPVNQVQVSVLDVGQGDAILLEASGGQRMLVDGGPDPDLLVRRLDERLPLWDRRIDLVVLTHPHEDHSGGLAGLAPRYRVGRIAETGLASDGAGVRELRAMADRLGISRVRMTQGDTFSLGAARVDVLWPPLDDVLAEDAATNRSVNDTSIVLGVSMGHQRALLTGDLEDDRDAELLAAMPIDGRPWDLLKVAHHGSATATSGRLLEAIRPRLAAISVGLDNDYGHPAPALLERLDEIGAQVWRTDQQGTLSVALDGQPVTTASLHGGRFTLPCPAATAPHPLARTAGRHACYARPDGGAHPNGSAFAAPVHRAVGAAAAARHRRRRGGLVPGLPRRAGGSHRGPPPGRGSRAPPRHRQGAAGGSCAACPRTRPGRRCLASRGRPSRAVAAGGRPSGHAAR